MGFFQPQVTRASHARFSVSIELSTTTPATTLSGAAGHASRQASSGRLRRCMVLQAAPARISVAARVLATTRYERTCISRGRAAGRAGRRPRTGRRSTSCHPAARASRCARDKDRAPGRRFRSWLRPRGEGSVELFRLAQSRQAVAAARPEGAGRPRPPAPPYRAGRHFRPESRARCLRQARSRRGNPARARSAAHRLRHIILWCRRSVFSAQGLRPADPG